MSARIQPHATFSSTASDLSNAFFDATDNIFDIYIDLPGCLTPAFNKSTFKLQQQKVLDNLGFIHTMNVRAKGHQHPEFSVPTYSVSYKTVTIQLPATKIDGPRSFDLEFRIDDHYIVADVLNAWKSAINNPTTGYATATIWNRDMAARYGIDDINITAAPFMLVGAFARPIFMSNDSLLRAEGITNGSVLDCFIQTTEADPYAKRVALKPEDVRLYLYKDVWISKVGEPSYARDGGGEAISISATFNFTEMIDPFNHLVLLSEGL